MSHISFWRTICTCLSSVASFYVFPPLTPASSFSHAPTIFPAPRRSDVKSIFLACPSSDRKTIMPFFQAERKPLPSLKQLERAPLPPTKLACSPSLPMQAHSHQRIPITPPKCSQRSCSLHINLSTLVIPVKEVFSHFSLLPSPYL